MSPGTADGSVGTMWFFTQDAEEPLTSPHVSGHMQARAMEAEAQTCVTSPETWPSGWRVPKKGSGRDFCGHCSKTRNVKLLWGSTWALKQPVLLGGLVPSCSQGRS